MYTQGDTMRKAVILLFLAILLFSCTKEQEMTSGNISARNLDGTYDIKWGADIITVYKILEDNDFQILHLDPDNEYILVNDGTGSIILLKFFDDKFFEASTYFSYYEKKKDDDKYGIYVNMLTDKYGTPYLASDTLNVWKFWNNSTIHLSYFIDITETMHFILILRDDTIYKKMIQSNFPDYLFNI